MEERSKMLSSAEKWPELKIVMGNKTQKDKITFLLSYAESRVENSYESRRTKKKDIPCGEEESSETG